MSGTFSLWSHKSAWDQILESDVFVKRREGEYVQKWVLLCHILVTETDRTSMYTESWEPGGLTVQWEENP